MLSVFDTGDASFRLSNRHDEDVGWIRGSAIGFDGFATEAEAFDAAIAGSDALTAYLEKLTGSTQLRTRGEGPTRVVHDGAYEWVTRGAEPLARLYRPERDRALRDRRRTFGVEFVLPSYVKPGAAISASQVVYKAIARSASDAPDRGAPASAPASAPARADGIGAL